MDLKFARDVPITDKNKLYETPKNILQDSE